jgi:hypothetical protein
MLDEVYGTSFHQDDASSTTSTMTSTIEPTNTKQHESITRAKFQPKKQSIKTSNPSVQDTMKGISYGTHFSQQLKPLAYTLDSSNENHGKSRHVHFSKSEKPTKSILKKEDEQSISGDSILSQSPYDIQDPECAASFRHLVQCKKCKEFMKYKMHMWWKTQQEANQMERKNQFGVEVKEPFINYGTTWNQSSPMYKKPESIFLYFLFGCILLVVFDLYYKFGHGKR